jgi:hypothetical protein
MQDNFPFVKVPEQLKPLLGDPDKNTRTYRRYGREEEISEWFDAIWKVCDPDMAVSPGGVSMFAKVSRAGVHKALKDGRLTAFCFHVWDESKWIKGKPVLKEGKRPYCYIPVVECRAWAQRLETMRDKKRMISEAQGEDDWEGKNLDAPANWKEKVNINKM